MQVTNQLTPPLLEESFVTTALTFAVPFTGSEVGAPLIGPIVGTAAVTKMAAVTNGLGLAAAVAVMVTLRPFAGTVAGAV